MFGHGSQPSSAQRDALLSPVVLALIVINGIVFALQNYGMGDFLMRHFALWPLFTPETVPTRQGIFAVPPFMPWQLLSYGFMHGNLAHIFFNMFALWMFGSALVQLWGGRRFLVFFLVCIAGAGLVQLAVTYISGGIYPTVGASGGVFGILLAFCLLFPRQPVMLIFLPVPIPAKYFVIGYGAIELFLGVTGTASGIAHFAHLGGMVFGYIMLRYWLQPHAGPFQS